MTESARPNSVMEVDRKLVELLKQRLAAWRIEHAEPAAAFSPAELADSQRWGKELALEGVEPTQVVQWLRHADSICARAACQRAPIAYLGPIYSYSYLAAVKFFALGADLVPVTTIAAAFEELVRGQASFGVVPIENSTDGRVVDTLGMFAKFPVEICGEVLLPIHHCLLGRSRRSEVREVHSKPQALSQCREWLSQHLPEAIQVEVTSTTAAAATAAVEPHVAAIASREAGIHHGLLVIDENIEDNRNNVTRFAVIGNRRASPTGRDKTSLMFQLPHQPGALADAMVTFQKANINLTWIESFPLPNCPNEYLFFVELEGHRDSNSVDVAIAELRSQAVRLEVLGSYPKGE